MLTVISVVLMSDYCDFREYMYTDVQHFISQSSFVRIFDVSSKRKLFLLNTNV